jgi:hypothetical protein
VKPALSDIWDDSTHDFCADLCHVAKVPPDLANEPWRRISAGCRAALTEAFAATLEPQQPNR